jgi:hypothetical protein
MNSEDIINVPSLSDLSLRRSPRTTFNKESIKINSEDAINVQSLSELSLRKSPMRTLNNESIKMNSEDAINVLSLTELSLRRSPRQNQNNAHELSLRTSPRQNLNNNEELSLRSPKQNQNNNEELSLRRSPRQNQNNNEKLSLKRSPRQNNDEELSLIRSPRQNDDEELSLRRSPRQNNDEELSLRRSPRQNQNNNDELYLRRSPRQNNNEELSLRRSPKQNQNNNEELSLRKSPKQNQNHNDELYLRRSPRQNQNNNEELYLRRSQKQNQNNNEELSLRRSPRQNLNNNEELSLRTSPRQNNEEELSLRRSPRQNQNNNEELYLRRSPRQNQNNNEELSLRRSPRQTLNNNEELSLRRSPRQNHNDELYLRRSPRQNQNNNEELYLRRSPRQNNNEELYLRRSPTPTSNNNNEEFIKINSENEPSLSGSLRSSPRKTLNDNNEFIKINSENVPSGSLRRSPRKTLNDNNEFSEINSKNVLPSNESLLRRSPRRNLNNHIESIKLASENIINLPPSSESLLKTLPKNNLANSLEESSIKRSPRINLIDGEQSIKMNSEDIINIPSLGESMSRKSPRKNITNGKDMKTSSRQNLIDANKSGERNSENIPKIPSLAKVSSRIPTQFSLDKSMIKPVNNLNKAKNVIRAPNLGKLSIKTPSKPNLDSDEKATKMASKDMIKRPLSQVYSEAMLSIPSSSKLKSVPSSENHLHHAETPFLRQQSHRSLEIDNKNVRSDITLAEPTSMSYLKRNLTDFNLPTTSSLDNSLLTSSADTDYLDSTLNNSYETISSKIPPIKTNIAIQPLRKRNFSKSSDKLDISTLIDESNNDIINNQSLAVIDFKKSPRKWYMEEPIKMQSSTDQFEQTSAKNMPANLNNEKEIKAVSRNVECKVVPMDLQTNKTKIVSNKICDPSVLEKRSDNELTPKIISILRNITTTMETFPLGTFKYKVFKYPADIEVFETLTYSTAFTETKLKLRNIVQNIIRNILNTPSIIFTDFKAGYDKRFKIYTGDITENTPGAKIIVDYNPDLIKRDLKNLFDANLMMEPEYLYLLRLVVDNISIDEFYLLNELLRTFWVLRWSIEELLRGYKILRGNIKLYLDDALIQGSIVKLDTISLVDADDPRYMEVTNLFIINERDKHGNVICHSDELCNYANALLGDVYKLAEYNTFKASKRLWMYLAYTERICDLSILTELFSTQIALNAQVLNDIEVAIKLVSSNYMYNRDFLYSSLNARLKKVNGLSITPPAYKNPGSSDPQIVKYNLQLLHKSLLAAVNQQTQQWLKQHNIDILKYTLQFQSSKH